MRDPTMTLGSSNAGLRRPAPVINDDWSVAKNGAFFASGSGPPRRMARGRLLRAVWHGQCRAAKPAAIHRERVDDPEDLMETVPYSCALRRRRATILANLRVDESGSKPNVSTRTAKEASPPSRRFVSFQSIEGTIRCASRRALTPTAKAGDTSRISARRLRSILGG
jgi:hypothetical protein